MSEDSTPRPIIHKRAYDVESFDDGHGILLIRGHLNDTRPMGLYPGDPDPLVIHDMTIELRVDARTMVIVDADARMDVRPNLECTDILEHYRRVIGLSIARGFTHKVRELFGGPRGCSHLGALLQAMAPVAVQSWCGMQWGLAGESTAEAVRPPSDDDFRRQRLEKNRNTCHIYADGGPADQKYAQGIDDRPIWATDRLGERGMSPEDLPTFFR